jgi:hypothetical protein
LLLILISENSYLICAKNWVHSPAVKIKTFK